MNGSWRLEAAGPGAVLDALGARFEVSVGADRPVRRTWLDTFDWQLYNNAVAAEFVESGRDRELVVHRAGERTLVAPMGQTRWPAPADVLPDGPVGAVLRPLVDIRALLPIRRERARRQRVDLRNEDTKTVARLHLETGEDGGRITLEPLRGYDSAAARAGRILDGLLAPADPAAVFAQAVAGSSRVPGAYTGAVSTVLEPEMAAPTAVSHVLHDLLDQLKENLPGTVDALDTEFLHDLRVAVRRTRSAVKLCASTVAIDSGFGVELRWLGDVTSRPRDLDVYLLELPDMAGALHAAVPSDLDALTAHLVLERARAQEVLVAELRSMRLRQLLTRWGQLVGELASRPAAGAPRVGDLAAEVIGRADRRVVRLGSAIGDDSPAEALHDLRKRAKELRYALEIFGSLYDPAERKSVVSQLKKLQDVLGRFQDTEVQRVGLSTMAATLSAGRGRPPVPTLLGMGELAGHLAREQTRARSEFAQRWAEFGSSAGRRRITDLIGSR